MAIWFIKVMTVVIKTTARPVIAWITHYNKMKLRDGKPSPYLNWLNKELYAVGQYYHYYNTVINRRLFKGKDSPIKLLPRDKAVEKGVEFVSEMLLYFVLIYIPLSEWRRMNKEKQAEKESEQRSISRVLNGVDHIRESNRDLIGRIESVRKRLEGVVSEYEKL